jgi:hypothetical protein
VVRDGSTSTRTDTPTHRKARRRRRLPMGTWASSLRNSEGPASSPSNARSGSAPFVTGLEPSLGSTCHTPFLGRGAACFDTLVFDLPTRTRRTTTRSSRRERRSKLQARSSARELPTGVTFFSHKSNHRTGGSSRARTRTAIPLLCNPKRPTPPDPTSSRALGARTQLQSRLGNQFPYFKSENPGPPRLQGAFVARRGISASCNSTFQLRVALLARECRFALQNRLHMLAVVALHLRGLPTWDYRLGLSTRGFLLL